MMSLWSLKTKCIRRGSKSSIKMANQIEAQMQAACRAWLDGEIATQTSIAEMYGVTRACISRRVSKLRALHGFVLSEKQIAARKTYGLRQMIVAQTRKPTRMTDTQKATEALWTNNYD